MALPVVAVIALSAAAVAAVAGGGVGKRDKRFKPSGRRTKKFIPRRRLHRPSGPIISIPGEVVRGARGELTIPPASSSGPSEISAARSIDTGFIPVGQWEYNFLVAVRALDEHVTGFARFRAQVVGTSKSARGDADASEIQMAGPIYASATDPRDLWDHGMDPIWTTGGALIFAGLRIHNQGALVLSFVGWKGPGVPAHEWYMQFQWSARKLGPDELLRPERQGH